MTYILVVTPDIGRLARHRRQIGRAQSDGLNTGFLVNADGVDGVGSLSIAQPTLVTEKASAVRRITKERNHLIIATVRIWMT